jgi:hypothetical protein
VNRQPRVANKLGLGARERDRLHSQAVRSLVRAAAALDTYEPDGLALALYSTGVAMLRIAQLDTDERAKDKVLAILGTRTTEDPDHA